MGPIRSLIRKEYPMSPAQASVARWSRCAHPTVGRFMSAVLHRPANDNGSQLDLEWGATLVVSGLALLGALILVRTLFQM